MTTSRRPSPAPWRQPAAIRRADRDARALAGPRACTRSPASAIRRVLRARCAALRLPRDDASVPRSPSLSSAEDLAFPGARADPDDREGRGKMPRIRRRRACWYLPIRATHRSGARRLRPGEDPMDPKLLEILVCPVTKGPLVHDREQQELISKSARLAYPIRDGIPVMLEDEARKLTPEEWEALRSERRRARAAADVRFTVLIPARYASTRLPGKPLADIARQADGRARRRARARKRRASGSSSPPTTRAIARGRRARTAIDACMTRADHPTGTDRLAEAAAALGLADDEIVVNVQGDEPLLEPALMRRDGDAAGRAPATPRSPPPAIRSTTSPRRSIPTSSRSCSTRAATRCTSAARTIPWARDAFAADARRAAGRHCRSTATTACMRIASRSCARSRRSRRRRSSASRRSSSCARCGTATASSCEVTHGTPAPGVDTPEDLARVRALFAQVGPGATSPAIDRGDCRQSRRELGASAAHASPCQRDLLQADPCD